MSKNYKWEVLLLLWIAFFVNQADRQVFNVVLPLVKSDLGLSDIQIGWIATLFNLFYAILVPVAGYFADIYSKKWIIVGSILFWSTATMFTGLSNGVMMLIIMRSLATGGGEAFFGPANYTLLAAYHKDTRSFAMSVHQTSYYVGIILSGLIAAYIGERWGWRNAFYIFGAFGVIHGIVMAFRLKDRNDGQAAVGKGEVTFLAGLKVLFQTPTALILTIAFSGLIFVLVGYLTWTPTYLFEEFGMTLTSAGFHSMFYTHLFAFVGILSAGPISDRLAKYSPGKRLLLQAMGLLFAAPFIVLMGKSTVVWITYIGFAGFGFGRAFFDANTYAVLYDVIPRKYRSTASGMMMMIGFSVGATAPLVLGYLKPVIGLSTGISLLSVVWLLCGGLLLVGYKYFFARDYRNMQLKEVNHI
ncbi:Sugar phosphate permease [Parapedobacter composti]|uniref:Sugar phosphate permease n=1 Tax=Parapedobacter composti TaxID=623281 RepID=A0A1I1GY67_9SPHI|nr:MFS transporter [Parapedobacter composti]SFC16789.1 Sugar phosphate permease [Parapedobacter composti]